MALSDTSKINISIKKLSGKAQTSNDKDLANEGLPTGLTLSSETVFGDVVPTNPSKSSLYSITGDTVEYLRLSASFIPGTDTSSGRHAFSLKLPDDYETQSSNSKKGVYPFLNGQTVYITSGSLQLVPTSFSTNYEAVPYHTASSTQTQIPVLDARDWNLDYFNGIFFQQDPPATGDSTQNPRYVDAFLYIGSSVKDKISSAAAGGADINAQYLVLSATGSLPNERVFTPGLGISSSDGGAGSAYTLSVKNSIVATLTGSQFSGNVGITGSFGATLDAVFGKGIEVNSSKGSTSGPGGNDFVYFGASAGKEIIAAHASSNQVLILSGGTTGQSPNEKNYSDMAFFVSGSIGSKGTTTKGTSVFGGDLFSSGTFYAPGGLSGSLTRLPDGSSYLIGGGGINISSASNGSITISFGSSGRAKSVKGINTTISAGADCDVSSDFSSVSYDFNKIDIFVNGQMLSSGSSQDYTLNTSKTGSIHFNFDLIKNDTVVSIVNN